MKYHKGEERLRNTMSFIIGFQGRNGYSPNVREICAGVGVKSPSHAHKLLAELEERDCIGREKNKSRAIQILDSAYEFVLKLPRRLEETLLIPIKGRIVAGEPIPMPESSTEYYDPESTVSILRSSIPARERLEELFALEVQGNSMVDSMINDGDLVIMRRVLDAENGDMVAVWLNDKQETTLKHFFRKNGQIILHPANPFMEDIVVENPDQLHIQGKVVMVIRQYQQSVVH
jgi:repressor LexA